MALLATPAAHRTAMQSIATPHRTRRCHIFPGGGPQESCGPKQYVGQRADTKEKPKVNAIKEARRFIERQPEHPTARVLSRLVLALETSHSFELVTLYDLDYDGFQLALDILREWRLDRYYAGKAKLFDLSVQVSEMSQAPAQAAAPPAP